MLKILKNFLILSLFLFTLFSAFPVHAADEICFKPQIKIPGMDLVFAKCTTGEGYKITGLSIAQLIIVVYKYAIGIVGILSAIILMWGGVLWLTAGGSQTRVTDAQAWIKGSVMGLTLALCSFLILSTVNPSLTKFKSIHVTEIKKTATDKTEEPDAAKASCGKFTEYCLTNRNTGGYCDKKHICQDRKEGGEECSGYSANYECYGGDCEGRSGGFFCNEDNTPTDCKGVTDYKACRISGKKGYCLDEKCLTCIENDTSETCKKNSQCCNNNCEYDGATNQSRCH